MTELSRNSRRQRRRVGRHMIHEVLVTLDLTPEEILAELEPNWFLGERDGERGPAEQVRTDEAAA
jgi:hypothetical protein